MTRNHEARKGETMTSPYGTRHVAHIWCDDDDQWYITYWRPDSYGSAEQDGPYATVAEAQAAMAEGYECVVTN